MESADRGVSIQFSEKALKLIRGKRLENPLVLVNFAFTPGGESSGEGCGGGGGCGGGCGGSGESGSTTYVPITNAVLVDGGTPGDAFVRVDTQSRIPVYLAKPVFEKAKKSSNPLFINVKGLVTKKLVLEGLEPTPSSGQGPQKGSGC